MTAPRHLKLVSLTPEPKTPQTRFSTVAEVARALRVSKMTVYRMIERGDLPGYRFGTLPVRIPTQAVWDFINGSRIDPKNFAKTKAL